ncbi:YeeE/YedE family protein [Methylobacter marinus]|uniref:YeeE/YedE family protein n=1 Tax=Methylobacter marinus TaxID=34058 RepID=UPI000378EEFF|nr:YeeE/YedE thiosulfate transporter family protein [Methylobacter marinus]
MENFSPVSALTGGALIGISATLLLLFNGRMAGISGIMNGVFNSPRSETIWRLAFLAGLVIGAFLFNLIAPGFFTMRQGYPLGLLAAGGFLVGFGTRMSNGCTSGHGICGLANLSPRSLLATLTFMAGGIVTVYLIRHALELTV